MPNSWVRKAVIIVTLLCFTGLSGCAWLGMTNIPTQELKRSYATPDDKYFAYQGMQVRYRDEGAGPAIVLLHGVCASLETWDGWVPYLKGSYRVIRLDIPGFGLSGPAPDKSMYTRDNAMAFLDAFLAGLNISSCAMIGNSLGSYLTWNYALDHPDRVSKIILIDSVGYNQKFPWLISFASNPVIRPVARRMMPRFFFDMATSQVYGDKSRLTPEIQRRYFEFAMREGNKGAYVDVFTELKKRNRSPELSKRIPDIKTPTLIMWGDKDEWIPYSEMDKWKKDLPSATFITYPGAGHIPMEEIPEDSVKDALAFLK
jgi:pimeloyl-ACP methyl ester carboxylesterase